MVITLTESNSLKIISGNYTLVTNPMTKNNFNVGLFNNPNTQSRKLLDAIGKSIFSHYYLPNQHLPSKKEFNWSIGKTLDGFDNQLNPDYILYVSIEATLATGERQALGFFTALAFGVAIPMGHSRGIAYLVDTKSGDIVWYNRTSGGAMRDLKTANITLRNVLSDFPK